MKPLFAILISFLLAISAAMSSDWEEDGQRVPSRTSHPAPPARDAVILEDGSDSSKGATGAGMLHGSATAVRTQPVAPSITSLRVEVAQHIAEVQRIDAGANSFLRTAPVNAITQPSVFRAFIEKNHPEFSLAAENNSKEFLLVVRGKWDDSTIPLHSLGLKCEVIKTKELPEFPLDKYKAVIIDCAGEVPNSAIQKIRDFVGRGGYLLTTDWALKNVLEQAFPGFVQWNRDNTEGVITDAFIVDPDSRLMIGLSGRRFTWKLDQMSECVRIINPERVHLIARSSRLAMQDPQLRVLSDPILAGGLALEFSFGRGKVLHLVGHFDNCSNSSHPLLLPDPAPVAGISLRQALATNFVLEALSNKAGKNAPESDSGDKARPPE